MTTATLPDFSTINPLTAVAEIAIEEAVDDYLKMRYEADYDWMDDNFWKTPYVAEFHIVSEGGVLMVFVEARGQSCKSGCCRYHERTYEFPVSDLYEDQDALKAKFEAATVVARAKEAERKAAADLAKAAAVEAAERKQLADLISKYGVPA